jgi:hypothetical protein
MMGAFRAPAPKCVAEHWAETVIPSWRTERTNRRAMTHQKSNAAKATMRLTVRSYARDQVTSTFCPPEATLVPS